MPVAIVAFLILVASQVAPDCADVAACRAAALEAAARTDYEAFHDLAWRTVQKGRPNDPQLMTMLARAQSLSGRPGDALVMLRRLAQMGVVTDAATSDDFRRVRALSGWADFEATLKSAAPASDAPVAERASPPEATAKSPARAVDPPKTAAVVATAKTPAKPALVEEPLPSTLASVIPAGLVYDAVSRRFIIGNRNENNLIVYDDVFKRATNMVGAESAGFYGLSAIEIDTQRGDLWVANSSVARGATLHKLQLVSGRVLFELPLPGDLGPATLVDAAVRTDGQVLLLDSQGRRLLAVSPAHRAVERVMSIDVEAPVSLALSNGKFAFVAHREGLLRVDLSTRTAVRVRSAPTGLIRIRTAGKSLVAVQAGEKGLRLVRLRLDAAAATIARLDVIDSAAAMPDPSGITVANGFVYYLTETGGAAAIRRVRAAK
ncbi:MAG: hypothetical protein WBC51_13625 [Vicinamibacterales bacterium]